MEQLNINYKIYLEADDISQSRIHSSIAFVKNLMQNCASGYLQQAVFEDESDLDAFALRFYIEKEIQEEDCSSPNDAESFVMDMAELLDAVAAAQSYMDMEGSFFQEYKGEKTAYSFRSPGGQDYCDFTQEQTENQMTGKPDDQI